MSEDLAREAAQPNGGAIDLDTLPWSEAVKGSSVWRYRFKDGPLESQEMEDIRFVPVLTFFLAAGGLPQEGVIVPQEEKKRPYTYWIKNYDWDRRLVWMQCSRRPGNADEIMRRFWKLQLQGKR